MHQQMPEFSNGILGYIIINVTETRNVFLHGRNRKNTRTKIRCFHKTKRLIASVGVLPITTV